MQTPASAIDLLDREISKGAARGLGHLVAEDARLDGRTIHVGGKSLVHFGSCSYLGLELDPRLKEAAVDAVVRYGAHFSSSRTYVSAPLYPQLEELLEQIFGAPVVVTATTTLGHLAALPVLCEPMDALILDHQAHHSLHLAANQVRAQGASVELVRHHRLDLLEERVGELSKRHRRVWYVGDGVYSMFGDCAPVEDLIDLADRFEQLHLYLDDAHGVSWCGERGQGYVLDRVDHHERLVVASTLGKCFGAGGAVVVFPNSDLRRKVRNCGGPLNFAGPIPPPVLGSAIAAARIHLSDELGALQRRLRRRIDFCNERLRERGLPLVAQTPVPLRFVGTGLPYASQNLVEKLMGEGFFANVAMFPGVPMRRAGVRFTLTLHHSLDDIHALVDALDRNLPGALAAEDLSVEDVWRAFRLTPPEVRPRPGRHGPQRLRPRRPALNLEHARSIAEVPTELWDRCLGRRGAFDAEGLSALERVFRGNPDAESNWEFHYFAVRDSAGQPVLATFFTEAIWKDDMLAPEAVSRLVEERRRSDRSLLTSKVFSMGSLLTEGNHLFLDRSRDWRGALALLLADLGGRAEASGAKMVALRDLPADDPELDVFLSRRGFTRMPLPASSMVEIDWRDDREFLAALSAKARRHQRHEVLPWEAAYQVEVLTAGGRTPRPEEFARFRRLYRMVKSRSLALNTFDLPERFFEKLLGCPGWELVVLRLRPEFGGEVDGPAVAVGACFVGPEQYVPTVLGLDYRYVRSHGLYRQCLLQTLRRARHHGLRRILLGMGAPLEKRRFGARSRQDVFYFQAEDHYHFDLLASFAAEAAGRSAPHHPEAPGEGPGWAGPAPGPLGKEGAARRPVGDQPTDSGGCEPGSAPGPAGKRSFPTRLR